MRSNLGEPLTIDDLARAAIFSKFHFIRVFQQVTGVSPGRFLSAVRLQEAKHLLSSTSLPVTEISIRVGYSSMGTFSSRFKSSVGVSPTEYRRFVRVTPRTLCGVGRCEVQQEPATVHGYVACPSPIMPIFLGLFPERILQGMPVRCTVLRNAGPFVLHDVPPGAWHLLGEAVVPGHGDAGRPLGDRSVCVGVHGPMAVRPGSNTRCAVELRPVTVLDPPVLLALCDLQTMALHIAADHQFHHHN